MSKKLYIKKDNNLITLLDEEDIQDKVDEKVDIAQGNNKANKNIVTDASGNITTEEKPTIPTKTSDLTNDSGFLTQHQDISDKLDADDLDTLEITITYEDTTSETVNIAVWSV